MLKKNRHRNLVAAAAFTVDFVWEIPRAIRLSGRDGSPILDMYRPAIVLAQPILGGLFGAANGLLIYLLVRKKRNVYAWTVFLYLLLNMGYMVVAYSLWGGEYSCVYLAGHSVARSAAFALLLLVLSQKAKTSSQL